MLLYCSGNQFIVNEAQNQRLLKDNNEVSVSQDIFVSQNPSAPPPYSFKETALPSRMTESASHMTKLSPADTPAGADFEEMTLLDPYN